VKARNEAVEAVHSRICEESLAEHMDPQWPGRCVKAVQAAAPHLTAQAFRDAADAIDAQRDESNPDRKPDEGWSVVDHRAGRFLGKTVAARMLRARAAALKGDDK
jgi:hypothetical protein